MKKLSFVILSLIVAMLTTACDPFSKKYESVPNDPLNTRIYTLDNGLKIYLSVNKDAPRIQTYIAVKVGGKNDPAETTGLAHYFEHLMFKGTQKFGTSDYATEKPMLDQIEQLFEAYRQTKDKDQRKAIYAQIDSLSQAASKLAIPNEYDKLMSAIGSNGTNAFTSEDVTAYVENIPSNQIENWAAIQSDRFTNPVLRLFHTELETVYEEYNMSLTNDDWKMQDSLFSALFPHHPYGTQTVLGTQEHLKNPSIANIKKYFDTYYVPNNMAICMVGDFDPDEVVGILTKHFGAMKPKDVPKLNVAPETSMAPVVKEVVGLNAENVLIGYRFPAANTKDAAVLQFVDYLLTNGKAGLLDLNLVKKQKMLSGYSNVQPMADYTVFTMQGTPKQGQTLDEVRDLLLSQLDILKKGEFDEKLLEAVINNFKLNQYYQQQSPQYAASLLLSSFYNDIPWADQVNMIDMQSKLTKKDVVDFSNKYFTANYATIYKRQGSPNLAKIDKPTITPIATNREMESPFLAEIKLNKVTPIAPVFLDYNKDMSQLTAKNNLPVLYKHNPSNPLFSLYYVFDMGNNDDKLLGMAFKYLNYVGTSKRTATQIEEELYQMASSFAVSATDEQVLVKVSGLNDNFDKALALLEERLADPVVDKEAYDNLVNDILKGRNDQKLNQDQNFLALHNYAVWGNKSPNKNILSASELKALNPQELINCIKNLKNYEHKVLYYGPMSDKEIVKTIDAKHAVAEKLQPVPATQAFMQQETSENKVLLVNYDAKQIKMGMVNKAGMFDKNIEATRMLYNGYFGGGMNGIVFQEMREARALAYTAWASYEGPFKPQYAYSMRAFIATQNDKMKEAIATFGEILNNMPQSEKAFAIAKESILSDFRTQRVLREAVLWNYLDSKEFGYDSDPRKVHFEKIQSMKLADVKAFQEQYVKNKPYTYYIVGNIKDLDMLTLQKIGKIQTLSQQEIFGY